ncbi:MAG TPA: hypothetical protein VK099_02675 [Alcanivoracaceae bacterium]|nr:hypothetical protein [Alcanivoracaceae bacterium]
MSQQVDLFYKKLSEATGMPETEVVGAVKRIVHKLEIIHDYDLEEQIALHPKALLTVFTRALTSDEKRLH